MTITLELSPQEEARLTAAANQEGLEPEAFLKKLMTTHLPPSDGATFAEILAPLQQDFEATGITDEEAGEFIDAEIKAYRAEQWATIKTMQQGV